MSSPASSGDAAARALTGPRRRYGGHMAAIWPARCRACDGWINPGDGQTIAAVPAVGRRWVHDGCAHHLGVPPAPALPERVPRGAGPAPVLRILVAGHPDWPRDRAVEVRDAIAALARGHRRVVLVHLTRTDPRTGRLRGLDAWAALTGERLKLPTEPLAAADGAPVRLPEPHPTVLLLFPLDGQEDPSAAAYRQAADDAGVPTLTHSTDQEPPDDQSRA